MTFELFSRKRLGMALVLAMLGLSACTKSPEAQSAKFLDNGKKLLAKHDPARALLEFRNAAKVTPRNPEVQYQLGLGYLAAADLRNAVASLRRALELDPRHPHAQLLLAQLMAVHGDEKVVKDAQQRLEAMLQDSPRDPNALHALALTELKLGDPEAAVQHLEQAITAAPTELILAATLAQAKMEQKDLKGAEEVLKKVVETPPISAEAWVLLGRFYLVVKRNGEAEQAFQRALTLKPDNPAALFNLAILQNTTGRKQEAEQHFKQLSTMSNNRVNYLYALYLFQDGRQKEAILEFERLNKEYPKDREVRTRLVAAYRAANRLPDAQKTLTKALKENPRDWDALLQRAELSIEAGELADAQTDLNHLLPLQPDSAEVHYALARLHEARGERPLQRQELTEALKWNPELIAVRFDLAKALIRDNAAQVALDVLDQAPPSQKNVVEVQEARNWALIALDKYKETRQGVDHGLRVSRTPVLLLQDALLKLSAKDYAAARTSAEEALEKNPGELRALRVVAQSYIDQKHMPEAVQEISELAARAPQSAGTQQYLGQLLVIAGKLEEARRAFTAAKTADPTLTAADLALAQLDANAGKSAEARKRAEGVLVTHPGDLSARLFLAQMDVLERKFDVAAEQYFKMLPDDSKNVIILNNLAYALAESGRYDEALKYGQQAKELAPGRADVDDTLGWVMYRKGVYRSAVQYLRTAVTKESTAVSNYHLAMAYAKAGEEKLGKATLQTARRLNPDLPEAKIAEQVLAEAGSGAK